MTGYHRPELDIYLLFSINQICRNPGARVTLDKSLWLYRYFF